MAVRDPLWDDFENSDNSEAQLHSMVDDIKRARQDPLIAASLDGYVARSTFFMGFGLTVFFLCAPHIIPGFLKWAVESLSDKNANTREVIGFHTMQLISYPLAFLSLIVTIYASYVLYRGFKADRELNRRRSMT